MMYSITNEEPEPMTALRTGVPMELELLVNKCLAKEADRRYQSTADMVVDLETLSEKLKSGKSTIAQSAARSVIARTAPPSIDAKTQGAAPASRTRERIAWAAAALACLALAAFWFFGTGREQPATHSGIAPLRLQVALPEGMSYTSRFAMSPNGRWLVALQDGRRLVLHDFLDKSTREVADADLHCYPFWSPDSRFIGFGAGGDLRKFHLNRGIVQTICPLPGNRFRGGSWNQEGTIVFGVEDPETAGIYKVSASGGESVLWSRADDSDPLGRHEYWPDFLPDGRHFIFWKRSDRTAHLASLDSRESTPLFQAESAVRYRPPGYLIFMDETVLETRTFDATALRVTGEPLGITDEIGVASATGRPNFSVSTSGSLVFITRRTSRLVWVDRQGRVHEIDEAGGQTFAAMAYIDGESLEKKIEAGPLELGEALVSAARFILGWADLIRICSLGFCIYLH